MNRTIVSRPKNREVAPHSFRDGGSSSEFRAESHVFFFAHTYFYKGKII